MPVRRRSLLLAGLALAAGAGPALAAAPQRITVVMVDDRFIPDHLDFQAGTVYRLRLENHGKDLHEFTAPEFFAAAHVADPHALANGGKEVVVQPGQTVEIQLRPLRSGQYPLTCADHDWDGMTGTITVH
jgi:uncharacterized cupredoxin-like copper-binding protein